MRRWLSWLGLGEAAALSCRNAGQKRGGAGPPEAAVGTFLLISAASSRDLYPAAATRKQQSTSGSIRQLKRNYSWVDLDM